MRLVVPVTAAMLAATSPLFAQETYDPAGALREMDAACETAEAIWPAALCGPIILVDPASREAVANRPGRSGGFEERGGVYLGQWPAGMPIANTALEWDGEQWAMVMLPLRGIASTGCGFWRTSHSTASSPSLVTRSLTLWRFTSMREMAGSGCAWS